MSDLDNRVKTLENRLDILEKKLDEDRRIYGVILRTVRQWAEDEKKYLEEYTKKLGQFEATLMRELEIFHKSATNP